MYMYTGGKHVHSQHTSLSASKTRTYSITNGKGESSRSF